MFRVKSQNLIVDEGKHALNNLIGKTWVTTPMLSQIATNLAQSDLSDRRGGLSQ
jgi:hypothetical protein